MMRLRVRTNVKRVASATSIVSSVLSDTSRASVWTTSETASGIRRYSSLMSVLSDQSSVRSSFSSVSQSPSVHTSGGSKLFQALRNITQRNKDQPSSVQNIHSSPSENVVRYNTYSRPSDGAPVRVRSSMSCGRARDRPRQNVHWAEDTFDIETELP